VAADDVGLEGANTSFQVHLRVDPDRFADHVNAAQLATGPVLAVAGNSPTFLGHRLWQETRVALFKQAVDDRDAAGRSSRRVSRVALGPAGPGPGRWSCWRRASGCTSRYCRWSAPSSRLTASTRATGPGPRGAAAAPGDGVALEPGHL
jgi:hypothetical protein